MTRSLIKVLTVHLVLLFALLSSGCFRSESQSRTVYQGSVGDQLVVLEAKSTTSSQSGIEVSKMINAAVAGVKGDLMGAISALKPSEPEGLSTAEFAGIGGSITAVTALILKLLGEIKALRRSDDEAWNHIKNGTAPNKTS